MCSSDLTEGHVPTAGHRWLLDRPQPRLEWRNQSGNDRGDARPTYIVQGIASGPQEAFPKNEPFIGGPVACGRNAHLGTESFTLKEAGHYVRVPDVKREEHCKMLPGDPPLSLSSLTTANGQSGDFHATCLPWESTT